MKKGTVQKRREQNRSADSRRRERAGNKSQGKGSQRCLRYLQYHCDCTVHIRRCSSANDSTWTRPRNVVARHAITLSLTETLQSAANAKAQVKASHWIGRLSVPGCCTIVPEVRWGDLRPPVFPASLEQLRTSKPAKLPQVHERLPPTKAAAWTAAGCAGIEHSAHCRSRAPYLVF